MFQISPMTMFLWSKYNYTIFIQHFCTVYDLEGENSWFVIYVTGLSLDLASTNTDKFEEPKIIKIWQLEAEILKLQFFIQKKRFFHFSSYVGALSLLNYARKQSYWVAFAPPIPKSISTWALRKNSTDFNIRYVILYKAQEERKIIIGH